uniref:VWFA domain-containing protein n=1 Tax=Sciurus vulgaris TaxID=55149 RepID=A0A8D2CX85_SCIVU
METSYPLGHQAQQYAVNKVCHSKTGSNHEYNVGLISLANDCEVLITLTPDTGCILSMLHTVQPKCKITFWTIIHIAHLTLKYRQGKNHKLCIIAFVGSPIEDNEKDLVKLAKHLKKEKVKVDIVNFGKVEVNTENVTAFVNTLTGKDGTCSHLVTIQQEFDCTGLPDLLVRLRKSRLLMPCRCPRREQSLARQNQPTLMPAQPWTHLNQPRRRMIMT